MSAIPHNVNCTTMKPNTQLAQGCCKNDGLLMAKQLTDIMVHRWDQRIRA